MRTLVVIWTFAAAAAACGLGSAFVCEDDEQCNDGGELGVCQAGGQCSFPDGSCPSGQRYGDHVGGGMAGECVPVHDDTGGSEGESIGTNASVDDEASADDVSSLDDSSDGVDPVTSTDAIEDTAGDSVDSGLETSGDAESTGEPGELDPDLVLWMTFDDPLAPLADASAYARDVTCDLATEACPEVVADGAMELAAAFDGTNDALQVPHDPALETDEGLTVAVSVRNDALSSLVIHTMIARPYAAVTENSWELFFRDENGDTMNDVVFEIADAAGQLQLVATAPVAKGEWTRIAAVWTVDSIQLYFDGVLQAQAPSTGMLLDDNPIVLAADIDNLELRNWFIGALDDVRVYRRALTGAEIAALP